MEAVENPPESPFRSQEPHMHSDSGTKVSKTSVENGISISIDGKQDLGDGGQVLVDGGETVDLGDDNEAGASLEDSEMNGVSSLLKMQESKNLGKLGSVLDVINTNKMDFRSGDGVSLVADACGDFYSNDVKEKGMLRHESSVTNDGCPDGNICELSDRKDREEEENTEDEAHKFGVGDFVWGKIKSHPWWPGRVYDPSDASDYAKKVKQRDKILVAYFGDGTFAWCNPTQLKPLDENFVEMSKQSSSKNFMNAVEKTMEEVGRLVDLKMTCACVPKENLIGFGRTLAANAGVKEGLLVPEGGTDKFLVDLFEPPNFLAALKSTARAATVYNLLEFSLLKSCLSAFYRAKGGYQLPSYFDPRPFLGLEDDTRSKMNLSDCNNGVEVRIHGPIDEDWHSTPKGLKYGQTSESVFHKCQGVSEDGQYQRRKQKSLAEILDGEGENKGDVSAGRTKSSKGGSLTKRKKMKFTGEDTYSEGKSEAINVTKEGLSSGKLASSSRRKKRKVSNEADSEGENKMENGANEGADVGKPQSSSGQKKRKSSDEVNVNTIGSIDTVPKQKVKKDAKISESIHLAENKVDSVEAANGSREKTDGMKRPGRKKTSSVAEDLSDGGQIEENGVFAERKDSLLRERKRSKYLSPPYTNIIKGQRKQDIEAESMKVSSQTKAASHLTMPSPTSKSSSARVQNKPSAELGLENETFNSSVPQTPKQDGFNVDSVILQAPASEVLSKIKSAALSPQTLNETNSLELAEEFFSAFRSSAYCSDHEICSELRPGQKRKPQKSKLALVEEQNQTDQSSCDYKSQQTEAKKNRETKLGKSKVKKAADAPDMEESRRTKSTKNEAAKLGKSKRKKAADAPDKEKKDKDTIVEAPDAALYVSFGPGSSLPSKNDLIEIYSKFGALNEEDTEMYYNNYCAKVVFLKSSEAEEAFNDSQLSSPFKSANATFRLRYLSAETKTRQLRDISSGKDKKRAKNQDKATSSQSSDADVSQLKYIKQKLASIKSLVETSEGKISPDIKSTLEGEVEVLLEKVSMMLSN